jgi:hypothetical protein
MKTAAIAIALGSLTACVADGEEQLYDGEGVKSEDGKDDASALAVFVDFEWTGSFAAASSPWNLKQAVQDHLLYTIGQLNGASSVGRLDKLVFVENPSFSGGKVTYKVKMPVAWGDKDNIPSTFDLVLPKSNDYDFLNGFAERHGHSCVDWGAHDVDSGSMWYYYRPLRSGCSLGDDVTTFTASVARSPINTTGKFPEFDKIWEDNTFNVLAIFGKYEDGATSGDAGISAYNEFVRSIKSDLTARGAVTSTPASIPSNPGVAMPDVSFTVTAGGKTFNVTALLTDNVRTGLSQPAFRARYEELSTRADFIVYNGHAGLGTNVRALAAAGRWVAGQYVVVFMNGCDTFAYIDSALNDAHKAVNSDDPNGTKYIDIVTNAMPSFFASMAGATMQLYRGLANFAEPTTYEQMFRNVDRSQVILVSGEQDNTFVPGGGGGGGETWDGLTASGTVRRDEEQRWSTPSLAPGRYSFSITGTRDADLYVRIGAAPTRNTFDCRPYKNGSNETCEVELTSAAPIHVMVRGWASSSDFELVGAKR